MNTEQEHDEAWSSSDFWSDRYQSGDHRWDLGTETPVFRALREHDPLFHVNDASALTIAIPGCGFGHDAIAFAQSGFAVTAIDFAPEPLAYLQDHARSQGLSLQLLERDIFTLQWDFAQSFDRVLEYTCYCAIDPSRREEYVKVMSAIVKPGGYLIGLFFPMDDIERDGPPFTVHEDEIHRQFEREGFVLISSVTPRESHPARAGREKLMVFRKNA